MSDPTDEPARHRFDSLTREHLLDAPPLLGLVRVTAPPREAWEPVAQEIMATVFPRADGYDRTRVFDADERTRHGELEALLERGAQPLAHRLLLCEVDGERPIGSVLGVQESYGRYAMVSTMIRREWQGRGLYTTFLRALLPVLRGTGFREVYSRHHADNGAVLVPKLKAGFVISAFELTASFGLLVHLRLALNENLRRVYSWRIEAESQDAELRALGILRGR